MKPKEKIVKDEKTYTFKMVMTEKDVKRLARAFRLLKSDAKKNIHVGNDDVVGFDDASTRTGR
jgi:hypothetical protein